MPMDAWRDGDQLVAEFDLPGVAVETIDLDLERNVLTVRADRRPLEESAGELIASERPRGVFSRQVILGDTLDSSQMRAAYRDGVLRVTVPVAEKAKPRKIAVAHDGESTQAISA